MKIKSITRYLFLNASILALIIAFASGIVLTEFFRSSAEEGFDERLEIVLKIIVADIAEQMIDGAEIEPPKNLGEPRFELPLSGWYWTISDAETGAVLLSSPSLVGGNLTVPVDANSGDGRGFGIRAYGVGPDGKRLRIFERLISFTNDRRVTVRVSGNAEDLYEQVESFQNKAWMIMLGFGSILLIVSVILMRTALKPLKTLQERVRRVTEGQSEIIEGDFPIEVSGLVNEANILISSNKNTLERARTQVGNLAHALKTPLSVITNEARDLTDAKGELLRLQSNIMRDQIQLYLERARMAARRNVIGTLTLAHPVISKLVEVMRKVHRDQTIILFEEEAEKLCFRGEQQDLEEMVGNLIDNGCKWANTTVRVTLTSGASFEDGLAGVNSTRDNWLTVVIEDDGSGMSDAEIELARKRGNRLDESKPGTGLGLSIVGEIADLYDGKFYLDRSSLGGVRATLILPSLAS